MASSSSSSAAAAATGSATAGAAGAAGAAGSASTASAKLIFAPGEETGSDTAAAAAAGSQQVVARQAAQFDVGKLNRRDLDSDPLIQFHAWFSEPALRGTVPETCTLSTAQLPSGRVSSRVVYLKELDSRGFVVYSNWETSNKAKDFATNGWVSLCFWWKPLERQVRVEGRGERLSDAESQVYFDTRARGSRIGAWASRQSEVLSVQDGEHGNGNGDDDDDDGRGVLEDRVKEVEKRFEGQDHIPVPPFWGGFRVVPDMIEFWQGRESRLHDRFRYTLLEGGSWRLERVNP